MWCSPDKLCTFENLCYHPDSRQFLFVLSEQSILQGLSRSEFNQLELASVRGHNRMFMNLIFVSAVNEVLIGATFKNENLFVIHTFKRDNIMHAIHDDLLPIFSTYQRLCGGDIEPCINKYRLTFVNDPNPGPYANLYQIFSKRDVLLLSEYNQDSPICFKEVRIGLVRSSLWFDYGFTGVQGRIANPTITGKDLRLFRDFILSAGNLVPVKSSNGGCVVFVKRTASRRIVNEDYVKETIINSMKLLGQKFVCLVEVDLLKDRSELILSAVYKSDMLVGMHGAGMALAAFLPTGAAVLEMFPFAIDPVNVSPIMAMCDLRDVGLHYVYWRNLNRSSSIPPATTDPLGGGIQHLPPQRQAEILHLEKVDAVPCCHDPAYLYYMFQDTVVGNDFDRTVSRAFKMLAEFYIDDFVFDSYETVKRLWLMPGPVFNIACRCHDDKSIDISWADPLNSAEFDSLDYEVSAVVGDDVVYSGTVQDTQLKLHTTDCHNLKLWICAKDTGGKLKSKDVFYECKLV